MKKQFLGILLCFAVLISYVPFKTSAEGEDLSDDIVILYTNDVHSYIDGGLSYDVIAAIKKALTDAAVRSAGLPAGH